MKLLLLGIIVLVNLSLHSQIKLAISGGINFNNTALTNNSNMLPDTADFNFAATGGKQGFNIGLLANIKLVQNWYIETGVSYTKKGGTTEDKALLIGGGGGIPYESNTYFTPSYIQVPVYILFLPDTKQKYKFSGGAGVYLGRGIGGEFYKRSNIGATTPIATERNISFGNKITDDFAPIELGAGARVGFLIMDNLEFTVSYQFSILNNIPKDNNKNGRALFRTVGLNIIKYIKK